MIQLKSVPLLYKRLGFEPLAQTEVMNRTGGTSFTMVNEFRSVL